MRAISGWWDITDPQYIAALMERAADVFGLVDLLYHSAGIMQCVICDVTA